MQRLMRVVAPELVLVGWLQLVAAVLASAGPSTAEEHCDRWLWAHPLPQANTLTSVAYADGRYLAVGQAGVVLESRDGETWSVGSVGVPVDLNDVTWDGARFVAVGEEGTVAFEGSHGAWQTVTARPRASLQAVALGASGYVAVGYDRSTGEGVALTNADGDTWHQRDPGTKQPLFDVAWTGSRFVAVGGRGNLFAGDKGILTTSDDGSSWAATSVAGAMDMWRVVAHGQDVVAAGAYCSMLPVGQCGGGFLVTVSHDGGSTWQTEWLEDAHALTDLNWSGGRFLGITGDRWMASYDGETWWFGEIASRPTSPDSLAEGRAGMVAVGPFGLIVRSSDGVAWQAVVDTTFRLQLSEIIRTQDRFVAIGPNSTNGSIFVGTSFDGRDWKWTYPAVTGAPYGVDAVAWNGSAFVAIARWRILTATDPSSWRTVHELGGAPAPYLSDLLWTGSQFFVTGTVWRGGGEDDFEGIVLGSPDGEHWNTAFAAPGLTFGGIGGSDGRLLLVGGSGEVLRSEDGSRWERVASSPLSWGASRCVAWGDGRFVVATGWPATFYTSPDGMAWSASADHPLGSINRLRWTGAEFLAVGQAGEVFSSKDGSHWTRELSNCRWSLWGVATSPFARVAVGEQGTIIMSPCQPEARLRRTLHSTR